MANIMKRNNKSEIPSRSFGGLVDNIIQSNLSRFLDDDLWVFNGSQNHLPVNIIETDSSYEMEVVVPGLRKEDFRLEMDNNMLTVKFDHREEKNGDNMNGYLRKEYNRQSFVRSFTLDESVDTGKIAARYTDGILHISLPKKEGSQRITRTIHVQ